VTLASSSAPFQAAGGAGHIAFTAIPSGCAGPSPAAFLGLPPRSDRKELAAEPLIHGTAQSDAGAADGRDQRSRSDTQHFSGGGELHVLAVAAKRNRFVRGRFWIVGGDFELRMDCDSHCRVDYVAGCDRNGRRTGDLRCGRLHGIHAACRNDQRRKRTFTLAQGPPCTFSFASTGARIRASGGNVAVQVTAGSTTCEREAASSVDWISITTDGSGTGSATVGYTVSVNASSSSRLGTM
jgi:hypothetical protein